MSKRILAFLSLTMAFELSIGISVARSRIPNTTEIAKNKNTKPGDISDKEIESLGIELNKLTQEGKYREATSIAKTILEWGLKNPSYGPNHTDIGIVHYSLGILYYLQGFYEKAEIHHNRSLKIYEAAFGVDHYSTASAISGLGNVYIAQGLYKKAEPFLKRALIINENSPWKGERHSDTAEALNGLALLYHKQGKYGKSEPLYKRSLKIEEGNKGLEHPDVAIILDNIGQLYQEQNLYQKAELFYKKALNINEKALGIIHPSTGLNLNSLGYLYSDRGLYKKSESLYLRALKILKNTRHHSAVLSNLGQLYAEQGLLSKAAPVLQRAMEIHKETLGSSHPKMALHLNSLARLYDAQGLYQKSKIYFQQALSINEKSLGSDHPVTARALNNLANLNHKLGLNEEAKLHHERALKIREKVLGYDHLDTARSLNSLAVIHLESQNYQEAEVFLKQSLLIHERILGAEHPLIAFILDNLGTLYIRTGSLEDANLLQQRSLMIRKRYLGLDHSETADSLSRLAITYGMQKKYKKFASFLKQSYTIKSKLIQREAPFLPLNQRTSYTLGFGAIGAESFLIADREENLAKLALFIRLNRQGLLEEIEKRQADLISTSETTSAYILELRDIIENLSALNLTQEQRKILTSRREIAEQKIYQIAPILKPQVIEVKQVRDALPHNSMLIEYQRYQKLEVQTGQDKRWKLGEEHYMAMLLNSNGKVSIIDLGKANLIDNAINTALQAIENGFTDEQQLIEKLSGLVIDPLTDSIAHTQNLFISPDSQINRIPFAALTIGGEKKEFLSERVNIRVLTTGRELININKRQSTNENGNLILANPLFDYVSKNHQDIRGSGIRFQNSYGVMRSVDVIDQIRWQELPGTKVEGNAVQKLIGGKLWTGEQATADSIKKAPTPKILHIASHAFYVENKNLRLVDSTVDLQIENPLLRSGIALAGANYPNSNVYDDGYLTALEVAQLDLAGTELVVISACDSGQGDIQSGEGLYGLKRSIAVAGARSSLLSLWKVDDEATAAFMTSFYTRLKKGIGRGDALSETQKEFRSHPNEDWREPYVWAAFQLSGDWRPIEGL